MLGDQAALRERCRQHRLVADEAHVGIERHDQADAGGRAVDRGDDRFFRAHEIGEAPHVGEIGVEVRAVVRTSKASPTSPSPRDACAFAALLLHALQQVHVRAGTKAASRARQHDDAHRRDRSPHRPSPGGCFCAMRSV